MGDFDLRIAVFRIRDWDFPNPENTNSKFKITDCSVYHQLLNSSFISLICTIGDNTANWGYFTVPCPCYNESAQWQL